MIKTKWRITLKKYAKIQDVYRDEIQWYIQESKEDIGSFTSQTHND